MPKATTLSRSVAPRICQEEETRIAQTVKDKKVVILCEETTDKRGQCILVVLLKVLTASEQQTFLVGGVKELRNANATECSRAVIEVIHKF